MFNFCRVKTKIFKLDVCLYVLVLKNKHCEIILFSVREDYTRIYVLSIRIRNDSVLVDYKSIHHFNYLFCNSMITKNIALKLWPWQVQNLKCLEGTYLPHFAFLPGSNPQAKEHFSLTPLRKISQFYKTSYFSVHISLCNEKVNSLLTTSFLVQVSTPFSRISWGVRGQLSICGRPPPIAPIRAVLAEQWRKMKINFSGQRRRAETCVWVQPASSLYCVVVSLGRKLRAVC